MSVTADDILMKCGGFGRFQIRMLILLGILIFPSAFITYMPMFVLTIPKHRCALDGYDNDTFATQGPNHFEMINFSIPWDDGEQGLSSSCYKYSSEVMDNGTREQVECSKFVYDRSFFINSFIEKFDLVCSRQYLRTHVNSVMMAGKIVAAITQGCFSDIFGRRKSILILIFVSIIVSVLSAFPFDIPSLLLLRFFAGFCTTSLYLAVYVSALEFVCPQYRRLFNVIWAIVWVVGGFLLTGVAYLVNDSQHLILAMSVPLVCLISYYWIVLESPRWLLSRGRINEACRIFKHIAKVNRKEFPEDLFQGIASTHKQGKEIGQSVFEDGDIFIEEEQRKENLFTLLHYKRMAFQFGILIFNWLANSLTYYALMFNVSNLSGSIYTNFLLLNCVDLVANIMSYVVLDRFGRKWSYTGFMLMAALGCLLCVIPVFVGGEDSTTLFNSFALIGRAGISTSFSIIYLFSCELFPTSVRNTALGSFSMGSKIGSFFSPYIADLALLVGGPFKEVLPMLVCGGVAMTALLFSLFLTETVGKSLPNTVADSLKMNNIADKKYQKCPQPQLLLKLDPESRKM